MNGTAQTTNSPQASARNDARAESAHPAGWLIYDPQCGMCTRFARRVRRNPRTQQIHLVPNDSQQAEELIGVKQLEKAKSILMKLPDGRILHAQHVMIHLGRWMWRLKWAYWLSHIPGMTAVMGVGYRFVARHRTRISRLLGLNACDVCEGG